MNYEAFCLLMDYIDAAIEESKNTHLSDSIRKRELRDELYNQLVVDEK